jgi:hypothetical protein
MRFGKSNIRDLYRTGSLKTVARDLRKHKLDLVGVQEVRWEKGGNKRAQDYIFFCGEGNDDNQLETVFFVHKRIVSAVRECLCSDRMSYIILRGRLCNIIVLNVHAPGDVKDRSSEELRRVFHQFPRYDMKNFLFNFNMKVGRK